MAAGTRKPGAGDAAGLEPKQVTKPLEKLWTAARENAGAGTAGERPRAAGGREEERRGSTGYVGSLSSRWLLELGLLLYLRGRPLGTGDRFRLTPAAERDSEKPPTPTDALGSARTGITSTPRPLYLAVPTLPVSGVRSRA